MTSTAVHDCSRLLQIIIKVVFCLPFSTIFNNTPFDNEKKLEMWNVSFSNIDSISDPKSDTLALEQQPIQYLCTNLVQNVQPKAHH